MASSAGVKGLPSLFAGMGNLSSVAPAADGALRRQILARIDKVLTTRRTRRVDRQCDRFDDAVGERSAGTPGALRIGIARKASGFHAELVLREHIARMLRGGARVVPLDHEAVGLNNLEAAAHDSTPATVSSSRASASSGKYQ